MLHVIYLPQQASLARGPTNIDAQELKQGNLETPILKLPTRKPDLTIPFPLLRPGSYKPPDCSLHMGAMPRRTNPAEWHDGR